MLQLAVLGLLKERTMHGYQLKKRLSETLGAFWQVSYGSLYPALKRLQREGSVEMVFSKEDVGRRKNVYRITTKGEEYFQHLLEESPAETGEDGKFQVRLAFFRYLRPETRIGVLERRRAYLEDRLAQLKRSFADYEKRSDGYTLSLMRHGVDATQSDIRWLDDLIEAERRTVRSSGTTRRTTRPARSRAARTDSPAPSPVVEKENVR